MKVKAFILSIVMAPWKASYNLACFMLSKWAIYGVNCESCGVVVDPIEMKDGRKAQVENANTVVCSEVTRQHTKEKFSTKSTPYGG